MIKKSKFSIAGTLSQIREFIVLNKCNQNSKKRNRDNVEVSILDEEEIQQRETKTKNKTNKKNKIVNTKKIDAILVPIFTGALNFFTDKLPNYYNIEIKNLKESFTGVSQMDKFCKVIINNFVIGKIGTKRILFRCFPLPFGLNKN